VPINAIKILHAPGRNDQGAIQGEGNPHSYLAGIPGFMLVSGEARPAH
jgi:hypothetical protein